MMGKPWPKDAWYVECASREEAEKLLHGNEHGTFLLRPIQESDARWVLSMCHGDSMVIHFLIEHKSSDTFSVNGEALPTSCASLTDLVETLRRTGTGLEIDLARPLYLATNAVAAYNYDDSDSNRGGRKGNSVMKLTDKRSVPCLL
eukprot:m.133017 g.133017  ORF g.133017 m.133017 type:complete len:146 (+) comp17522_c0_seq1:312-749(+)